MNRKMKYSKNKIYKRIKAMRVESGITQKKLAEMLNISQQTYQLYESGKREIPLFMLIMLADYYGVSLDYLTDRVFGKDDLYYMKEVY